MSEINDAGGPAFPTLEVIATDDDGPITHAFLGMTLRDYFAAKAMQGELASQDEDRGVWQNEQSLACRCYRIADAMLKAREA